MSWSGTVYCSYCNGKGHNRRSCEGFKQALKDRYERAINIPSQERSHYDTVAIERWEARQKKNNSPRKCSYCNIQGHNRRGCEELKTHMAHVHKHNVAFKKAFLEHVQSLGLGIGALVRHTKDMSSLLYVKDLKWGNVNVWDASSQMPQWIDCCPVSLMGNDHRHYRELLTTTPPADWLVGPKWSTTHRYIEERYSCIVDSSTPSKVEPPAGWLENDKKDLKMFFEDRVAWQWIRAEQGKESGFDHPYSCEYWNLDQEKQELKESA
jgi:hypothetical protein